MDHIFLKVVIVKPLRVFQNQISIQYTETLQAATAYSDRQKRK